MMGVPQKLVCHLISNALMEKMAQKKNRNEGGEKAHEEGKRAKKLLKLTIKSYLRFFFSLSS
jgi:hypothetical protein